jgi:hypothetical protein
MYVSKRPNGYIIRLLGFLLPLLHLLYLLYLLHHPLSSIMASNLPRTAHEEHLALLARLNDVLFVRHQAGNQAGAPIRNTSIVVRPSGPTVTYVPLNIMAAAVRSEFQNLILRMTVSMLSSYEPRHL